MTTEGEFFTEFRYRPAHGLGPREGLAWRDPSCVIRVGSLFHTWYSRTDRCTSGYDATVWHATSEDGDQWEERAEALARGGPGEWDEQSVFTPNVLVAQGRYYLFYTSVEKPFSEEAKTAIGAAVADSPCGPWTKLAANPLLVTGPEGAWDSHRVDDACLIVRGGRYWLYFKGRQMGLSPRETNMGVAIADRPEGPYVKYEGNPVVRSGHEVLVWPHGEGVAALIQPCGPEGSTVQYSPDGLHFSVRAKVRGVPPAPGAFRPDAFTDPAFGEGISWGVCQHTAANGWPYLERFDCDLKAGG